jgi:hypothetical protein
MSPSRGALLSLLVVALITSTVMKHSATSSVKEGVGRRTPSPSSSIEVRYGNRGLRIEIELSFFGNCWIRS